MTWWEGLAAQISDPEWVAGVLANALSAGLAIVGAWWVLQHQVRAERATRRAERRGEVARAAGYRILDIIEPEDPPPDTGQALSHGARDDGVCHLLLRPMQDIGRDFESDDDLFWLWMHRMTMWNAARTVAMEAARSPVADRPSRLELAVAWQQVSWPNDRSLGDLGRLWIQWDGEGDLPRIDRSSLGELAGMPVMTLFEILQFCSLKFPTRVAPPGRAGPP